MCPFVPIVPESIRGRRFATQRLTWKDTDYQSKEKSTHPCLANITGVQTELPLGTFRRVESLYQTQEQKRLNKNYSG